MACTQCLIKLRFFVYLEHVSILHSNASGTLVYSTRLILTYSGEVVMQSQVSDRAITVDLWVSITQLLNKHRRNVLFNRGPNIS